MVVVDGTASAAADRSEIYYAMAKGKLADSDPGLGAGPPGPGRLRPPPAGRPHRWSEGLLAVGWALSHAENCAIPAIQWSSARGSNKN